MSTFIHRSRRSRGLIAFAVGVTTAAGLLAGAPASVAAAAHHPAALVGKPIELGPAVAFGGYDVAANAAGTAYIGWISSTSSSVRKVHLCTLPVAATACSGGIQTIPALDPPSASGLKVILTPDGVVHLVWFHDTVRSGSGPDNAAIAEATALHGLHLTPGHDVITDAPSFGSLLDVERGPGNKIWTVTYDGGPKPKLRVHAGYTNADTVAPARYGVGYAQLAFAGKKPILDITKGGFITAPGSYSVQAANGAWSAFHNFANTWAVGTNVALVSTSHGVRAITATNDASYRPVLLKWTGSGFSHRTLTADDNSCAPSSHDGATDGSGRLLDASWECGKITIADYADAAHASIYRYSVPQTSTQTPQIASGTRGIATVAYSYQSSSAGVNVLKVIRVRLPDATRTVAKSATGGRVTVTGPVSCLPPVNVHVGWTHRGAHGWSFRSGSFKLGAAVVAPGTLDGSRLRAGKTYTLTGTAVFGKGSARKTIRVSLPFRTCAAS